KERIASRIERIEASYGRRILRGTGVLATIGATAPFVGLFGTVWGIMNSFIGISKSHTTNLAVVAPGIAEALLATALGLAAAIPAVVIYNMFARSIAPFALGSAMPRQRCCGSSAAIWTALLLCPCRRRAERVRYPRSNRGRRCQHRKCSTRTTSLACGTQRDASRMLS